MDTARFLEELDNLFELHTGTITPQHTLQHIPGWSSLTFMGLLALIDEELGLTVSPEAVLKCTTVADLLNVVGLTHGRSAAA